MSGYWWGLDAVPLVDLVAVVAGEFGDTADRRVEQGDVVVDELDRVAVAGDHVDLEALVGTLLGEGREDVVGLVVLFRDGGYAHRLERLLQERDLSLELGRGLGAGALVLGVLTRAEREPGDVERHRQVGGLLALQEHQQHRDEAVDRVGVLPLAVHEAVDRQRVEGPEGERVAVDDHEGRLCGVRHPDSLPTPADTEGRRRP